jgi:hypothetical protein
MNKHLNQVNLAKYGNGVYHMAVKIYSGLPKNLKVITNDVNKFKVRIKKFLTDNDFYTLDEFVKGKRCVYQVKIC